MQGCAGMERNRGPPLSLRLLPFMCFQYVRTLTIPVTKTLTLQEPTFCLLPYWLLLQVTQQPSI